MWHLPRVFVFLSLPLHHGSRATVLGMGCCVVVGLPEMCFFVFCIFLRIREREKDLIPNFVCGAF